MISNDLLKRKILDSAIHGTLIKNDLSLQPVEYNQIGNKYSFELPPNWKWLTLSQISTLSVGKTPSTNDNSLWDGDIDWISISDMKHRKYVTNTSRKITSKALEKSFHGNYVEPETLIMSFKLTIGRLSITSKKCVHNEAIVSIIPLKNISRDYLMYALDGMDLEKNVKSAIKGKTLNSKSLAILELPIPPYEEQLKIVNKVKELFELIDRKEINDQINQKYKKILKEKVLDNAIHGTLVKNDTQLKPFIFENEIESPFDLPTNWKWTKIENIFDVKGGKRIPKGESFSEDGKQVYIRVADMENMSINTNNLKYIDERVRSMIKNYIITKDDLYITVAGTIGQVGSIPVELDGMNLTENANRLIPKGVDKEYYKYILNGKYMQECIRNNTTKAAQPKLAIKRINELIVPVPPLEEQHRIVEKIEQCFELIEQL